MSDPKATQPLYDATRPDRGDAPRELLRRQHYTWCLNAPVNAPCICERRIGERRNADFDNKPPKPVKKFFNERKGYVGPKVTTPPTAQQIPVPTPRCPRAKSDMTPCYLRYGDMTVIDILGRRACVGCEISIEEIKREEERN